MGKTLIEGIQARIRERDYHYTLHAADRMTERRIAVKEVEEALLGTAEVIEDYPQDPRSPSCLVLGATKRNRPLHVQCTYPPDVAVITAYEPQPDEWMDCRIRRGGRQ